MTRDYLGYVSSLARESQLVGMETGGAGLDGMERSRTKGVREMRIRLGDTADVDGGWEVGTGVAVSVGKLGIGSEQRVKGLDRRKLYL